MPRVLPASRDSADQSMEPRGHGACLGQLVSGLWVWWLRGHSLTRVGPPCSLGLPRRPCLSSWGLLPTAVPVSGRARLDPHLCVSATSLAVGARVLTRPNVRAASASFLLACELDACQACSLGALGPALPPRASLQGSRELGQQGDVTEPGGGEGSCPTPPPCAGGGAIAGLRPAPAASQLPSLHWSHKAQTGPCLLSSSGPGWLLSLGHTSQSLTVMATDWGRRCGQHGLDL